MKIGFSAVCKKHNRVLDIQDTDFTLNKIGTGWIIDISGWYCPAAVLEEEYSEGDPSCKDAWWLIK